MRSRFHIGLGSLERSLMKKTRGSVGCFAMALGIPVAVVFLYMALIVRPERLALEEKLRADFLERFGGEPTFVETDSKNSTWDYFLETFRGPKAYFVKIEHDGREYHAYVRKTRDWEIQPKNRSEQGDAGKPDPASS